MGTHLHRAQPVEAGRSQGGIGPPAGIRLEARLKAVLSPLVLSDALARGRDSTPGREAAAPSFISRLSDEGLDCEKAPYSDSLLADGR